MLTKIEQCYCEPSRDYEDCRYYSVAFDMGANIPHCVLNPPSGMEALSYCPCIDNKGKCKQYISKKDPNGDFIAGQQRMVDTILEIIDKRIVIQEMKHAEANDILHEIIAEIRATEVKEIRNEILALKGGEGCSDI